MKPHRSCFCTARAALGALALAALSGCGSYVSEYVPPADGRARPVYRDGAVAMELGGAIPECLSGEPASDGALPPSPARTSRGAAAPPVRVSGGFWVPVYFGPPIVVERRGVAPRPHHHHRHAPDVARTPASPGKGGSPGPGGNATSVSGGGGGGDDGAGSAAAIVLATVAVLALVALPPVAVGLSIGRPERDGDSALALDQLNAYNDLARTPGSPCALAPGGQLP
ncbi:hypothetical protein WMF18_33355 [Sorangium sp. So ce315]|uniref:hypothetical protein n=1 Tax=Sorangium sp. So ce315 TaxID=3133299 RepID=UPI003F5E21E7